MARSARSRSQARIAPVLSSITRGPADYIGTFRKGDELRRPLPYENPATGVEQLEKFTLDLASVNAHENRSDAFIQNGGARPKQSGLASLDVDMKQVCDTFGQNVEKCVGSHFLVLEFKVPIIRLHEAID